MLYKKLIAQIAIAFMYLAVFIGTIATITGIGYALYQWAHDMSLPQALWAGFVMWLKMLGGALVSLLIGLGVSHVANKHL